MDWSHFQNSVENGLGLHALSFAVLPATAIYDQVAISSSLRGVDSKSHIYVIGEVPKVDFLGAIQIGNKVCLSLKFSDREFREALFDIPEGMRFGDDGPGYFFEDDECQRYFPNKLDMLNQAGGVPFEVLYIGQSFGKSGERKALDRLQSHSTLQKIALSQKKSEYELYVLLFELADNMLF